ncbi:Spy/CpxP family protein refolding chaperone [Glaciecola siphonariae]|uniref:Spy/CpxP family protein refolding chaperone n=1 Tax=Glaciecola siphonariae TaxID=521012 RepID=A0ABV9LXQ3_9ALTE
MKRTILLTALAISLASANASLATAAPGHNGHKGQISKARIFAGLDLSDIQKQDIREIMRQVKQDNAVYAADIEALKAQMEALFNLETFDAALAQDLVRLRTEQAINIELNIATAKHQAWSLLNDEQKAEFAAKQEKRAEKERQRKALDFERLQKRLNLTDEQSQAISDIQEQHRDATAELAQTLKASKDAEKALVYSNQFSEEAWLTIAQASQSAAIEFGVAKTQSRFDMLQVLDDEQRAKFKKIVDREQSRKKHGKKRNKPAK